jgi:hypothetical protein
MLIAMIGVCGCLAAVAYGAGSPHAPGDSQANPQRARREGGNPDRKSRSGRPPRPRITQHPETPATSTSASFSFIDAAPRVRFECRLDEGRWRACRTPTAFVSLEAGHHAFYVRAISQQGRSLATRFRWKLLEPKPFSIVPELSSLSELYPGTPAVSLPLAIQNPNSVPIFVTGLRVLVSADPSGCPSANNLALAPSNASSATPLRVAAGRSVELPARGISPPSIRLRDLATNQDACQGVSFPLEFRGRAHG